jgi:hypothetical protein
MNKSSVNSEIDVLGLIKAIKKIDNEPTIPPRKMKVFRPYLEKKSIVGPKTNFIIQGIDAIPPTIVVVDIEMSFSVKNNTSITVVSARIKPSEKYKSPKRMYFKIGRFERSIIKKLI